MLQDSQEMKLIEEKMKGRVVHEDPPATDKVTVDVGKPAVTLENIVGEIEGIEEKTTLRVREDEGRVKT
jgi:hypothetical protein